MGRHHKKKRAKHVSEIEEREKIRESILTVFRAHLAVADQGGALLVGPSKGNNDNEDIRKPSFTASRRNKPESDSSSDSMSGRDRRKRRDLTKRKRKSSTTQHKTKQQPEKDTGVYKHMKVARGITYNKLSGVEESKEKYIPVIGPGRLTHKVGIVQTGKKSAPAVRSMTIPDHISRTVNEDIKKIVSGDDHDSDQQTGEQLDQAESMVFSRGSGSEKLRKHTTPASAKLSNHSNCSSVKSLPVPRSAESTDSKVFDVQDIVLSVLENSNLKSMTKHLYPGRDYLQETLIDLQKILKHFGTNLDISDLMPPFIKNRSSKFDQEQPLPYEKMQDENKRHSVETEISGFEPLNLKDQRSNSVKKLYQATAQDKNDRYGSAGDTGLTKSLQNHGSIGDKQPVDFYSYANIVHNNGNRSGQKQDSWSSKPTFEGFHYQTTFNPTVISDFKTPYTSWKQSRNVHLENMVHMTIEKPKFTKSVDRSSYSVEPLYKSMENKNDVNSFVIKRPKEFDNMQLLIRELDKGRLDENNNNSSVKKPLARYPYEPTSDAFDAFFKDSDQNKAELLAARMDGKSSAGSVVPRTGKPGLTVDALALLQTNDQLVTRGEPMEVDGKQTEILSLLQQNDMLEGIISKRNSQGSIDRHSDATEILYQDSRSNSQCSQCSRTLDQEQVSVKPPDYRLQSHYCTEDHQDAMAAGDMTWQHHRYNTHSKHPKHVMDLMDILDYEEQDEPSEHGHCKPSIHHQSCLSGPATRNRNRRTRSPVVDSPSSPNVWSRPRKMY